jgi:hypothetical protein
MYHKIDTIIQSFSYEHIPAERKEILNQLITYIRLKKSIGETDSPQLYLHPQLSTKPLISDMGADDGVPLWHR